MTSQEDILAGAPSGTQSAELQLIEFGRIRKATNNFSETNKLGSGGFGTVYEVILSSYMT